MAVMALLPTLILLLLGEGGVRIWFASSHLRVYQASALWQLARGVVHRPPTGGRTVLFEPLARSDPLLGYVCRPGVHEILIDRGSAQLRFRATIGDDGFRITGPPRRFPPSTPRLWLMGCSYTWGFGVSDEETFAWILQRDLDGFRVENLSCNGYGTTQGWLLMRAAFERRRPVPALAVIVYNLFHLERNVAAADYIRALNGAGEAFGKSGAFYPQARLEGGALRVVPIPLFQPLHPVAMAPPASPVDTTIALFRDMRRMADQMHTRLLVAFQSGPDDDPVIAFARRTGLPVVDIRVNIAARGGALYSNLPFDSHPNALAHQSYAAALYAKIRSIVH
jgi:hypothetical protein